MSTNDINIPEINFYRDEYGTICATKHLITGSKEPFSICFNESTQEIYTIPAVIGVAYNESLAVKNGDIIKIGGVCRKVTITGRRGEQQISLERPSMTEFNAYFA